MTNTEALDAVRAVVAIAKANFPADANVSIIALGKQHASVELPSYLFAQLLKNDTTN